MAASLCNLDAAALPKSFHTLTDEDAATFGTPDLIPLDPPTTNDPFAAAKRRQWIEWRAAPYPAGRHSEYLYRPAIDSIDDDAPRILISAVLRLPDSLDAYLAAAPRRRRADLRGQTAINHGYFARPIDPASEAAGIWQVIHSSDTRQGRAVASMFADRPPAFDFPSYIEYEDPNYTDICTGIFAPDGALAAYLLGKRVGEHVYYDEIMAHAAHQRHQVMWVLHAAFIEQCLAMALPPRILHYGPWYSGAKPYDARGGLNQWKRKALYRPAYLIHASSSADSRAPAPRS